MPEENNNFFAQILKDKAMIWIFRIVVPILFLLVFYKIIGSDVVDFFGLKTEKTSDVKHDNKMSLQPKDSIVLRHDSIVIKPDTTPKVSGKNVNTGTNTGIIGDNGTILKEKVLHPTTKILNQIKDSAGSKNTTILVDYEYSQMSKNRTYCIELINLLKKQGYNDVQLRDGNQIARMNIEKKVGIIRSGGSIILFVDMY